MRKNVKDKLVGIYAPGHYEHISVLEETQEFSRWFWDNHEDMEFISSKLGISTNKLNRILTLEQLPDEELLARMGELCK
ncbi:ORF16 [Streptococcus phage 01205]|uniref:ORF16 n=1 Tax=Streptococcus phage O1205 TaxID=85154 RepID=O34047_BPO12|nr:ORF16 [Streptococcus phage 01205]AAC79532.1 ORF16 [Streptococcus phage 01205]